MGEGIERALSLFIYMQTSQNGYVFIDEIENGLHYSIQSEIWRAIAKAAKQNNCQVFATTHSYELIKAARNGLKGGEEDALSFFRLDRENERIIARRFDFEMLDDAINSGLELR